jgi:integrase
MKYQTEAQGRKSGTIKKAENALKHWDDFTNNKAYKKTLLPDTICSFKDNLRAPDKDGHERSPGTVSDILLQLKPFFHWLSEQPGYKSVIQKSNLQYFNPNQDEKNYRYYREVREYPTQQQVMQLYRSVNPVSLPDQRDKALIAFMYLSGLRIDTIASLTIGSFDSRSLRVDQNPNKGIRTKFSKHTVSYVFEFDDDLTKTIRDWHALLKEKGFGNSDPLFPKAAMEKEGLSYTNSTDICKEPITSSRLRKIIKERFKEANLPYFNPHSFRHAAVGNAIANADNAEEIKAISQNMGHESVIHIFNTYGKLPEKTLQNCIKNIGKKR